MARWPPARGGRAELKTCESLPCPWQWQLSVVAGAAKDDNVVDEHGAHVFLEPHLASYLDDKLLDAEIDGKQVRFAVSDQR